jgi:RNA polymerase sigma-70 factor, ECF subfamily
MTQGKKPHKQPPLAAMFAPSRRGNIARRKVFVRMVSVGAMQIDTAARHRRRRRSFAATGRERALGGFRQGIEAAVPALRRYARALTRNGELADDLVQDTLVRALRSEHLFHGGDIRSWLYTILTNLNRNRLRALARRPPLQAIEDNDAPEVAGPEAGARDIERALASLVEDQRSALLLVVLEGLSYHEVAQVQGVPIGTVMSRLARARMQIKAYLDGERPALRRIK